MPYQVEAEVEAIKGGSEPDLATWVKAVQASKERYLLPWS